MKVTLALLGLAIAVTSQPSYDRGSKQPYDNGYGPRHPNDDGYGPKQPQQYGKDYNPVRDQPQGDIKTEFDTFYDNVVYCKNENKLEACIISSTSRADCTSEARINTCTTAFVNGLCKDLGTTVTQTYNNGKFHATTSTCVDAGLADSMLVYNKLLREVNTALSVTTAFDEWTFTTIKLALASTRNYADCVTRSFFNYLTGCAKYQVLSKKDVHCLDDALSNGKCEWAYEASDGWNLPQFLKKYGDVAFNKVIKEMKHRWGTTQEYQLEKAIKDLQDDVTDQVTQMVEFVNTDYDFKHSVTSLKACALPIPGFAVDADEGTDADTIRFHFPIKVANEYFKKRYAETEYGSKPKSIYKTCAKYYSDTKKAFNPDAGKEWTCLKGWNVPIRINEDGDAECWSIDGEACAWQKDQDSCLALINPVPPTPPPPAFLEEGKPSTYSSSTPTTLSCGVQHEHIYGYTGYNYNWHWCHVSRLALGNARDKCFTYSGYSIKFLETGDVKPLKVQDLEGAEAGANEFGCKKVSWYEQHSCSSHLTQWQMQVGCCKSYGTVLKEFQDAWAKKYAPRNYNRNGRYLEETATEQRSEPRPRPEPEYPSKPTDCPPNYDPSTGFYEKTIISKADAWAGGKIDDFNGGVITYEDQKVFTTDDIPNVINEPNADTPESRFQDFFFFWFSKCRSVSSDNGGFIDGWCNSIVGQFALDACQAAPTTGPEDFVAWCATQTTTSASSVLTNPNNPAWTYEANAPADRHEYGHHRSCYIGNSDAYSRLCNTLKRSWDMNTVIPIVSTKCFPESCVMSQLAQCMEIPDKDEDTGYNYVAQPTYGYQGYRPASYGNGNYGKYPRTLMGMESTSLAGLAAAGFVAGAAVVAIAQVMLKARASASAQPYMLV